jgi:DNA-binding CsgD family transcriptional regulator
MDAAATVALGEILERARSGASLPELHMAILSGLRTITGWDSAIFIPHRSRNERPTQVNKEQFVHLTKDLHKQRFASDIERGRVLSLSRGGLYLDSEVYSAAERRNLPFFAEIMRPQGITSRICINLEFGGVQTGTVHVCRHSQVGQFSTDDVARLRPLVAAIAVADAALMRAAPPKPFDGDEALTPREREVVDYVCRGLRTRDIALCLGTSPKTVGNQLQKVFDKLNVSSRAELVAWVLTSSPSTVNG